VPPPTCLSSTGAAAFRLDRRPRTPGAPTSDGSCLDTVRNRPRIGPYAALRPPTAGARLPEIGGGSGRARLLSGRIRESPLPTVGGSRSTRSRAAGAICALRGAAHAVSASRGSLHVAQPGKLRAGSRLEPVLPVPFSMTTMTLPMLRSPRQRVGTLPNAALPPPNGSIHATPSVETLLREALVERDPEAFGLVFQELWPEMLAHARSHVRSRDEAEDVVQDTWLAALRGIHRFQGRSSLRTWLLRILRNRAITTGTRSSRMVSESQLGGDDPSGGMDFEAHLVRTGARVFTPEEIVTGSQLNRVLRNALSELPECQREVLVLRDLDGLSAAETEERLSLTPGNQRVLLHRARARLKEIVSREWA